VIRLLATSAGTPRVIGTLHGEPVRSSIGKAPVAEPRVFVGRTNIAGDAQADLAVHGGPDKAIYVYPSDNWPWWEREHAVACRPNSFGENLTVEGANETAIRIGDRFRWGEALLEVSQPRGPCYKLGMALRADVPRLMTLSARAGWYCRVLEEGQAPTIGMLEHIPASDAPSVRDAFLAAYHPHVPKALVDAVWAAPALAENWKSAVAKRREPAR